MQRKHIKGFGWCVYDHKFRQKALNPCLKWSDIDQQLWLLVSLYHPKTWNGNITKKANSSGAADRAGISTSMDHVHITPDDSNKPVTSVIGNTLALNVKVALRKKAISYDSAINKDDFSWQYVTIDDAIQGIKNFLQGCFLACPSPSWRLRMYW